MLSSPKHRPSDWLSKMKTAKDNKGHLSKSILFLGSGEKLYVDDAARTDAKKKKRLVYILIGGFVFVCIMIPMSVVAGLLISMRQEKANRPPRMAVPNVVGQEYRKGASLLKEKGLKMRVLAVRWDQNQPVGIIVDQSPLAGENVLLDHTVAVTIGGKPGQPIPSPER